MLNTCFYYIIIYYFYQESSQNIFSKAASSFTNMNVEQLSIELGEFNRYK